MKKLLILFAILVTSLTYSQNTIQITPEQAKEAIKTKRRVQVLEIAIQQQVVVIDKLNEQVNDLQAQVQDSETQNNLWEQNYKNLKTQFEAEKAKKPKDKTLLWILRCLAAGAAGYVVGNITN